MKKKLVSMTLAVLLGVSLVACGDDSSNKQDSTPSTKTDESTKSDADTSSILCRI